MLKWNVEMKYQNKVSVLFYDNSVLCGIIAHTNIMLWKFLDEAIIAC